MSQSFQVFLESYIESWKFSLIEDMKKIISVEYQAREIRNGEIFDFGYEESMEGWTQAFHEFRDKNVQWVLEEKGIIQLKENEIMAILSASLIIEGKPLETVNLFFQTFRLEDTVWKLMRSYIEAGLPLIEIKNPLLK
ncbi:flavoprotein [Fictibacillus arsenicus]|uniref:Flavoprotein n=1 Tax=Fictibacillus arsenicus TaxID=255247 RepID=A0A1V3G7Q8_9BACL|nr:flavoprotein [Fictibacillus arsenicus]OOE12431.1 flavoprotein [Fictibacillus arsenicus]